MASNDAMQFVERLTLHEQFRLVEIAHETSSAETRAAALRVLMQVHPPRQMLVTDTDGRLQRVAG